MEVESAEKKFWKTPELVEELLDFLDLDSIKQLAKHHVLTKEILGKEVVWQKILKRAMPLDEGDTQVIYFKYINSTIVKLVKSTYLILCNRKLYFLLQETLTEIINLALPSAKNKLELLLMKALFKVQF